MKMSEEERVTLFAKLETKGWYWKGEFIYSPHESLWLRGADPWMNDLPEFHARMTARLSQLLRHKADYSDEQRHQEVVSDTAGLVVVLRWLIH